MQQKGFTVVELIIVLVVISILAVGAFISWPGRGINVYGQATQLANDVRYTQVLSMTKGQRYRLVKTSSTTYQIQNSSGTAIIGAMGSTTVTLGTGISFGTLTNLPNSLIAFDGNGTPYVDTGSPGTALSSTATMPLTDGSNTNTVSITPQTGRVTIQ